MLMQGTWIGEECQGVGAGLSSRQTNRLFPPPSTSHTSQLHPFVHTSLYTFLYTPLCTLLLVHLLVHLFAHTCCTLLPTAHLCTRLLFVHATMYTRTSQLHLNIYPLPAAALSCTCNLFEACWAFFVARIFFATINFSPALSLPSSQMTDRQAGCELGTQLGIIQKS